MKQLQNNYTTPEQSKRLLELGVPADSADLGIIVDAMYCGIEILQEPYSQWCKGNENISMPCWSVGRLIEIYVTCKNLEFAQFDIKPNMNIINEIIERYELSVAILDFSKLEE